MSHLGSLIQYLIHKKERIANDRSAHLELQFDDGRGVLPRGLTIEWLGTSGFRLSYEGSTLIIDPYLSRAPMREMLLMRPLAINRELVDRAIPKSHILLAGHTHFDHVVDIPYLAARDGAEVFGSRSLHNLLRCSLGEDAPKSVIVEPHRVYERGPFRISFVPSLHSKLILGKAIPFDSEITCEHLDPLTAHRYGCGQTYGILIEVGGVSFYHQGSCDLIDEEIRGTVDILLAGIAGRRFTENYLARLLGKLEPKLIIPHHYDDFFEPIEAPLAFSLNVNLSSFIEEVRAVSKEPLIGTLEPLRALTIS